MRRALTNPHRAPHSGTVSRTGTLRPVLALGAFLLCAGAGVTGLAAGEPEPAGLSTSRNDLTPKDLARVDGDHPADRRFFQARAVRADAGRRGHLEKARQSGRVLAFLGQHHLRGRRHLQARQRHVPQAVGVVAVLDAGVRWPRAVVQRPRLPELPSQGRARPSAGGPHRRDLDVPRLARTAETAEEKAALADRKVLNFPDPVYGGQLQDLAVPGLAGEGKMAISYAEIPVTLGDGTTLSLRKPSYSVEQPVIRPAASGNDAVAARQRRR